MDDKNCCKIGEPSYPVAAVDRGKRVLVNHNTTFVVSDHDFTKCGIIPSVTMLCNISKTINKSFYTGKVHIGLKECIFEPSSPMRHITELYNILKSTDDDKPYLFIYTDGGPDH